MSCSVISGYFKIRDGRRCILESTLKHTHLVVEAKTLVISNDLCVDCYTFECIFLIFVLETGQKSYLESEGESL